mgnify:CR=1 FL=1
MSRELLDTLRWQFDLTWRLAQHYLPELTDDACLWAPAPDAWTVRKDSEGRWRADWAAAEPDPAPPTTIGWLTWHVIWWWSGAAAALVGNAPPARDDAPWPGDAASAVARIGVLAEG